MKYGEVFKVRLDEDMSKINEYLEKKYLGNFKIIPRYIVGTGMIEITCSVNNIYDEPKNVVIP